MSVLDKLFSELPGAIEVRIAESRSVTEGFEIAKKLLMSGSYEQFDDQIADVENSISELQRLTIAMKLFCELRQLEMEPKQ